MADHSTTGGHQSPRADCTFDGRCLRCGSPVESTAGCQRCVLADQRPIAVGAAPHPAYQTFPDIRAEVAAGKPVPAQWVRELLEDYNRLRRGE